MRNTASTGVLSAEINLNTTAHVHGGNRNMIVRYPGPLGITCKPPEHTCFYCGTIYPERQISCGGCGGRRFEKDK